jgi:hypothetical protein
MECGRSPPPQRQWWPGSPWFQDRRLSRYRLALCGLFPAKDVVVWTMSEIQQWAAVPEAFITTVLNDGRVLYERSG